MVSTSRGILKYSTDRASANEFGGTIATSEFTVTNERSSKCFGSTIVLLTLVKILNSSAHAQVVSVTRYAVGNHSLTHLLFRVRINHVVLLRHAPDPAVALDHETP